jgi:hypothetical protein
LAKDSAVLQILTVLEMGIFMFCHMATTQYASYFRNQPPKRLQQKQRWATKSPRLQLVMKQMICNQQREDRTHKVARHCKTNQ